MIKFFRKIRQRMISENRVSKYLLYAIGEIALVMIGILLALQVNNYNEQRKDRAKEQVILQNLREDYQADLRQLEVKMLMRNEILQSAYNIFDAMDNPIGVNRDSLIFDIAITGDAPTFDPIQNDLISSGNLRLIRNVRLSRLLSNWSSDVIALQEIERVWEGVVSMQYEPVIAQLGISRDVVNSYMNQSDHIWLLDADAKTPHPTIGNSKVSTAIIEILSSKLLEGVVANAVNYNEPANIQSAALVRRIHEILNEIEKEINSN
jgi:hypothetical protein